VIRHRRDDAVDVLVVEQSAVFTGSGQIRSDDLFGERVPAVVQVGGTGAGHAGQPDRCPEQAVALHAHADHAEPDGVAGSQGTKREGVGGKRDTGGSPKFEEFAASPGSFVHEEILSPVFGLGNQ